MVDVRQFRFLLASVVAICVVIVVALLLREHGGTTVVSPDSANASPASPGAVTPLAHTDDVARVAQTEQVSSETVEEPSPAKTGRVPVVVLVVDSSNAGIPNASVSIIGDGPLGTFAGDAHGRCELPILSEDAHVQLRAAASGFVSTSIRSGREPEIRLTLQRAISIHGQVVRAGTRESVPFATVRVSPPPSDGDGELTATADGAGAFEVRGVSENGRTTWIAACSGFATSTRAIDILPRNADLVFELKPGVPMRLQVVDAVTQAQIAGAHVRGSGEELVVDASGMVATSALLATDAKDTKVRVDADGYCETNVPIRAEDVAHGDVVRLPLVRGVRLTGVVRGSEGVTIEHSELSLDTSVPLGSARLTTTQLASHLVLPPDATIQSSRSDFSATSDGEGRFTIDGLLPWYSKYEIVTLAPGRDVQTQELAPTGEPGSASTIEITLPPRGDVGVLVGDVTFNAAPCFAYVQWKGAHRDGGGWTDDHGHFRIENVECGAVSATVSVRRMNEISRCLALFPREKQVDVHRDGDTTLDFAFTFDLASIRGHVTGPDGADAQDVSVSASAPESCFVENCKTDKNGRFELRVDPTVAGYQVEAGADVNGASVDGIAPNTDGLELALPGVAHLRLRVISADRHEPQSRFHLSIRDEHSLVDQFDSIVPMRGRKPAADPDGWYIVDVKPGRYRLVVGDTFGEDTGLLPSNVPNVVARLGETVPVEIIRERGLNLELALAPGMQAWPSREFTVMLLESELWSDVGRDDKNGFSLGPAAQGRNVIKTRTVKFDDKGHAKLTAMDRGTYRFKVWPDTMSIEPSEVTVPLADDQPLVIRWTRK